MPALDVPRAAPLPAALLRAELPLPELSEPEVVRHFTNTSRRNFSIDQGFYPLGSCTMKYNPKINDRVADLPGLALLHPYQEEATVPGMLRLPRRAAGVAERNRRAAGRVAAALRRRPMAS